MAEESNGWIAVDLDGTLAIYENWHKNEWSIGRPIPQMVDRVKQWILEGKEVKILTARAGLTAARNDKDGQSATLEYKNKQVILINQWCLKVFGQKLPVTACKDFKMIEYWDDRCIQVIPNTGIKLEDLNSLISKQQ